MLGARIDPIQPHISNLICHCQTKKQRQLWLNEIKEANWTETIIKNACLQRTLLIRKGSIKYCFLFLWARLKISCISWLCCVWNNVCVHVCKTTNWRFTIQSFVIIYTLSWLIVAGGWMGRWAVLGMVTEGRDWVVRTSHFYRSHNGLWQSTATSCRLCALYI